MKRWIALLLAVTLLVTLCACGKKNNDADKDGGDNGTTTVAGDTDGGKDNEADKDGGDNGTTTTTAKNGTATTAGDPAGSTTSTTTAVDWSDEDSPNFNDAELSW